LIPRLALTLGEPAGIGPDICLALAQSALPAEVVVIASPDLLKERAQLLGLDIELYPFEANAPRMKNGHGRLAIVPVSLQETCHPGTLKVANAAYVLETLTTAYQLCIKKICDALVTGPIHKALINQSGFAFSGHTEFLAQLAGVKDVLMTFHTPEFLMGLVTTHYALSAVPQQLTAQRLERAITLLHAGLKKFFQKENPIIRICGLNPHAGENGHLGSEEQTIISPVIKTLQAQGFNLQGPVPADTAFTPENRKSVDGILAMYHDQGLAPLKALFFNDIVNVTLGLPFLRTSVDHGTALSLAGTGQANPASLTHALNLAARFYV